MNESVEKNKEYFKYPNVEKEIGEFERVQEAFGVSYSALMFAAREVGELIPLDRDIWDSEYFTNTDSKNIEKGNWEAVHDHSYPDGEFKRDWEDIRDKMLRGKMIDAPIVMKHGDKYHVVSGNTRLMVSRALGITPKVLLFEVDSWKKEPKTEKKSESDDS